MSLLPQGRILAVGAHPDDVELGCAGTLARMKALGSTVWSLVMSRCEDEPQAVGDETREAEFEEASRRLGVDRHFVLGLPNRRLPDYSVPMMDKLEEIQTAFSPDLVFIPFLDDSHQDHAAVAWACVRVFRRRESILQYEILRFGSHTFTPSLFIDVTTTVNMKCEVLRAYSSQLKRRAYFDEESLRSLARTRGAQSGCDFAEGFVVYKQYW